MSDPFQIVWDALDAGSYGPHGRLREFRSRCSGHDGDNPDALHVWDNGDGSVRLWCHAHGCTVEDILEPLSLRVRDLFPVDLGDTGRRLRTARREDFTGNARTLANVLLALQQLGARWSGALWLDECPNCQWHWAQLSIGSTGEPKVSCQRGCDLRMFNQALANRLAHHRRRSR